MPKNSYKYIIYAMSALFWVTAIYSLFYIPSDEWQFMKRVEAEFNNTDDEVIKVKDVTDFDWDTVCYVPPQLMYKGEGGLEMFWGEQGQIIKKHIPNVWWPTFLGAYLFIDEEQVVKSLVYKTWGLRWKSGQWQSLPTMFSIDEKKYFFLTELSAENDFCISKQDAVFKSVYLPKWNVGRILISNSKKH